MTQTRSSAGLVALAAVLFAGAALLTQPGAASAAPNHLTLQGYLTESSGAPADGQYTLVLALYGGPLAPTSFWEEEHTVSVVGGVFDAVLGADGFNPLTPSLFVDHPAIWLGVTVLAGPGVPTGGEDELPRRELSASAYAFVAGHADTAATAAHATTADAASHATTATNATAAASVTCAGCVNLTHLAFDPATQAELDAAIAALDVPTSVDGLAGGTITSAVSVTGTITASAYELTSGGTVCTSAGGCGATLANLTCVAPNDIPVYDHNQGQWKCGAGSASGGTVATDLTCSGCVDLNELAFDPVTEAELVVALAGYVTSGGLTSVLADFVSQAALSATLNGYATVASLSGYVTAAELQDTLAGYALVTDVPTTVDGLGGGTITGAVTVSGTFAATEVRQNGNVVCDASGNCGQTLADLACTTDQTIRYDGGQGRWVCGTAAGGGASPGISCVGDYKVLQWTGEAWQCRDLRQTGLSAGEANGWEIVDNWGDAWDAIERPPASWHDALDDCVADGGRLPLATELWRNRASAGGTGNFADVTATRHLWTYNHDVTAANRDTVRLSDGNISASAATAAVNYRCIWPKHQSDAFDGGHCFGPPGQECTQKDLVWHLDRYSRPALDAVSAAFECRFYNASLMDMRTYQEIVQVNGFDFHDTSWHWVSDQGYWDSGGHGYAIVSSATSPNRSWGYDSTGWGSEGSYSGASSVRNFRCIGKKAADIGTLPTPNCIENNCFTVVKRGAVIVADNQDRPAALQQNAFAACAALGGRLPRPGEFFDLVQAGWENGTNAWLWMNESVYVHSNAYRYGVARWTGVGAPAMTLNSTHISTSNQSSTQAYRCVWTERFEDTMTVCGPGENQVWTGEEYDCVAAVSGSVSNEDSQPSNLPPFVDAWGNAWDLFQRPAANYDTATATCASVGGRLPTVTELWRVRFNHGLAGIDALGQSTDTTHHWTIVPSAQPGFQMTLQLSNGATGHANGTLVGTTNTFRCIWPTTKGDALSGRSCYGIPTATDGGCFTATAPGLRIDAYDRAPVYAPSAAWECRFYGGRLPVVEELQALVHAGAPNGSGEYLHLASPTTWSTSNTRGTELARFLSTHGTTWAWAYTHAQLSNYRTASLQAETSLARFRCVFSNQLN